MLEASAGTGKTYALAALVTRYVAEGKAVLDDMLLITFSRAASQELRERVRDQLVAAAEALDDPSSVDADDALLRHLTDGTDEQRRRSAARLRDALAGFDAATIATTHQFCQLVLRSLGVAGDTDAGVTLVENLDQLVGEVVDDLYLQRFGDVKDTPALTRAQALELAHEVVRNPRTRLTPLDPPAETTAGVRRAFADDVLRELERRKRLLGILGFDDLLGRLAVALEADDAPARDRMRRRWWIVMVDEFQDTDPVQWEVIERAFVGQVTLVLIGDPKQAIYAFRGGDVVTYLRARERADALLTLDTNYRSDAPLVQRLLRVLDGAALGHDDIVVRDMAAHRTTHRLAGAPRNDPFRLRVVSRDAFRIRGTRTIPMDDLRPFIAADLAADVKALLVSDATYDGGARSAPATSPSSSRATATRAPAATRWPRPGCPPSTPATPTSSPPRPRPTGSACSRRSSSPAAAAWSARRRPRCSSAGPLPSWPRSPTSPTRSPRPCAAGPTTPGPAASRPSSRRRTSPGWPSGCSPGAAASGT